MEGLPIMEAPDPRTVPRLGELPSPSFEEGVVPEYVTLPSLIAFFYGSGKEAISFSLGLSTA